jgi:hypothetical protein
MAIGRLRSIAAVVTMAIGSLQAWDAHVLQASGGVIAMVAIALVTMAVASIATTTFRAWLAWALVGAALLVVARMVSSVPLPGLFIVLPITLGPTLALFKLAEHQASA